MADVVINGAALQINLLDADVYERFEGLVNEFMEAVNTEEKGLSEADQMRRQIRLTDKLMEDIFGEGSAAKIFKDNTPGDLRARLVAVADLVNIHEFTQKDVEEITERGIGKYSQRVQERRKNRQQRRHPGKR